MRVLYVVSCLLGLAAQAEAQASDPAPSPPDASIPTTNSPADAPASDASPAIPDSPAPDSPDSPAPDSPDSPAPDSRDSSDSRAPDAPPTPNASDEVIEISGRAPTPAGATRLDAQEARKTAGALGEPFRAIAMLPGVTSSIAASGYPIIRGTLPGESRFEFDGIELPMLYHLLLGTQVIHPALLGDLTLRAGGADASHGHLLGGLVEMTAAPITGEHTELNANPIELGAYHARMLGPRTAIAVAGRVGTLTGLAKLYDTSAAVDYVDQQTRLVHTLGNGDQLALTSLAAYDHVRAPPDPDTETLRMGFHRLDLRWTRDRAAGGIRAGATTELDSLARRIDYAPQQYQHPPEGWTPDTPYVAGDPIADPTLWPLATEQNPPRAEGGRAYGIRAYADARARLAPWLTVRGGVEGHHRAVVTRAPIIDLGNEGDPYLGIARSVDTTAAWAGLALTFGPIAIAPSARIEHRATEMIDVDVHTTAIEPRLAITAALPGGADLELAGGMYTAPPQVTAIDPPLVIGPLPTTDGTAALAGLSRGYQAQAALRTALDRFGIAGAEASLAAYYRDTEYAVDFSMLAAPFTSRTICGTSNAAEVYRYRNVDTRALGIEAMVRGRLAPNITGWASYSLGKIDRDLGFLTLPHDYDQRHTLNASAQWQRRDWTFGASASIHSGRPAIYPRTGACVDHDIRYFDELEDPTHRRRLPATWRLDLRAEHVFHRGTWTVRGYVELQNATIAREVYAWEVKADYVDPANSRIVESSLLIPLPLVGVVIER